MQRVIPSVYPSYTRIEDGILDTINALKEIIKIFDQDIISLGFKRSKNLIIKS